MLFRIENRRGEGGKGEKRKEKNTCDHGRTDEVGVAWTVSLAHLYQSVPSS